MIRFPSFRCILLLCSTAFPPALQAQTFYNHGTIKYERKTNAYRLADFGFMKKAYEQNKFITDTFTLSFDSLQSLYYMPEFKEPTGGGFFSFRITPDGAGSIYKNHETNDLLIIRQLQEEKIAIADSIRNIDWKVTDEFREIAGFQCQKFIGVIYDSVYVVAFVTDQILVNDGPESFANLPGMIMGMAIPRLYTSWMAVSFDSTSVTVQKPTKLPKSKYVYTWQTFESSMREQFNGWNDFTKIFVWFWGL